MDRILEYIDAIKSLVPGAKFGIYDNDLTRIDWQDESISQPSDADIEAELVRLQAEYDAQEYARKRQTEYPSIPDQLDEIYHNGINAWKAIIKKTKDKHPKG